MKKINIIDVHKHSLEKFLKRKMLSDVVVISKHFIERMVERNIEMYDLLRAIDKLSDTICQIIYRFELGDIVDIKTQDRLVLKLEYFGGKVQLMTCYYRGVY